MKKLLFITLAFSVLFACKKEDMLEKERKEMQKELEGTETLIYRGLKVTLRSLPASMLDSNVKTEEATKIQALTLSLLSKALGAAQQKELGITDYIGVFSEMGSLKETLKDADEDKYPTILEIFFSASNAVDKKDFAWYNSSLEHLILAMAWAGSSAPRSFRVYETTKIEPAKISDPSTRLFAHMVRGATFHLEKWNYSSEDELSQYLDLLEKERKSITGFLLQQELYKTEKKTEEQVVAELRAAGYGMRAIARIDIDKKDEAIEDLNAFVKEAEAGGVADKEMLESVKDYLANREKGSPLLDKKFIAAQVAKEIKRRASSVDWYSQISGSETGSKFLGFGEQLSKEFENMKSAGGSIGDQAKGLFDKLTQ